MVPITPLRRSPDAGFMSMAHRAGQRISALTQLRPTAVARVTPNCV